MLAATFSSPTYQLVQISLGHFACSFVFLAKCLFYSCTTTTSFSFLYILLAKAALKVWPWIFLMSFNSKWSAKAWSRCNLTPSAISAVGICKEHNQQLHQQYPTVPFFKGCSRWLTWMTSRARVPVWGGKLCTMHGSTTSTITWPLMCGVKRVALPGKTSMKRSFIEFQVDNVLRKNCMKTFLTPLFSPKLGWSLPNDEDW